MSDGKQRRRDYVINRKMDRECMTMRHIISSHGVPDDKASDAAELAFDCLRWLTDKMLFSDTLEIDHPLIEICRFPVCVIGHRVEAITGQQGRVEVG